VEEASALAKLIGNDIAKKNSRRLNKIQGTTDSKENSGQLLDLLPVMHVRHITFLESMLMYLIVIMQKYLLTLVIHLAFCNLLLSRVTNS